MKSQRNGCRTLARLNRGRRKKLQVGEFTLWGCSIRAFSKEDQSAVAYLDDWADLVFGCGLEYGGLTSQRWMDVLVSGRGPRADVQAKIDTLKMWLDSRFRKVDMTPMFDLNDSNQDHALS